MDELVKEFRLRFPEFETTPTPAVVFFLNDAMQELSKKRWASLYQRGLFYLTAHLIAMQNRIIENGNGGRFPVSAENAGELSVSYVAQVAKGDTQYELTCYGQEFLRLRKLIAIGALVV